MAILTPSIRAAIVMEIVRAETVDDGGDFGVIEKIIRDQIYSAVDVERKAWAHSMSFVVGRLTELKTLPDPHNNTTAQVQFMQEVIRQLCGGETLRGDSDSNYTEMVKMYEAYKAKLVTITK